MRHFGEIIENSDQPWHKKSDDSWVSRYYAKVHYGLSKEYDLDPIDSHLIALVDSLSNEGRSFTFIAQEGLAELMNVSLPTVNDHLSKLEDLGRIQRSPSPGRRGLVRWRLGNDIQASLDAIKKRIKIASNLNKEKGR